MKIIEYILIEHQEVNMFQERKLLKLQEKEDTLDLYLLVLIYLFSSKDINFLIFYFIIYFVKYNRNMYIFSLF